MKTTSDLQPKHIEDYLDNVDLYFVTNYFITSINYGAI